MRTIIPFFNLPGMVIDYDQNKVGVVLGVHAQGIIVEDIPEVDSIQNEVCPNCKTLEHLKSCLEKPNAQQPTPQQQIRTTPMRLLMYSLPDGRSVVEIVEPSLTLEEARKLGAYLKELNRELQNVSAQLIQ